MKDGIDLQHFQFALNSLLAILEDAHTYFMPEGGLIYPYEIRWNFKRQIDGKFRKLSFDAVDFDIGLK